jgi:hypothetical protein
VPLLITECGLQAATLPEVLNIATTGYVPEDIEIHQQNQSDDVCYEDERFRTLLGSWANKFYPAVYYRIESTICVNSLLP